MDMLMRVQVIWVASHQREEQVELLGKLPCYSFGIVNVSASIDRPPRTTHRLRLGQVEMQTYPKPALCPGEGSGFGGRGMLHHETRGGDYPATVSLKDSSVDAVAHAEVVGVH